jgi:4-amino-4-deoxy-L-arabinose transferase-like glycosyltransferase/membrane-associated phospholipid phosphatase
MNGFLSRVAADLRVRSGWLVLALALSLAALAVHPFDQAWSAAIRAGDGVLGDQARAAVAIVKPFGRGEILVVLALLIAALGNRLLSARILVAGLVLMPLITVIKRVVGRERPNGGDHSFPSGDAATAVVIAVPIAMTLGRRWWWVLLPAAGCAVGRVVEGWHWPADVLAGAALGTIAAVVGTAVVDALASVRRWPRPDWRLTAGLALVVLAVAWSLARATGAGVAERTIASFSAVVLPALLLALALRWWRARQRRPAGGTRGLLVVVAVAVVVLYVAIAGSTSLWDRDEPRNATATLEMLASGDYLVPTFNGEPRLHKPILPYWLMAGAASLFGHDAWAVRLPAILAALGIGLGTAWIAARFLGAAAGVAAAAVVWTAPLVIVTGTAATTDAVLLVGIIGGMMAITWLLTRPGDGPIRPHLGATVILGLAAGWAQLAKGPIGLAVPLLAVIGCWLLLQREDRRAAARRAWVVVAVVCGLSAIAWAAARLLAPAADASPMPPWWQRADRLAQVALVVVMVGGAVWLLRRADGFARGWGLHLGIAAGIALIVFLAWAVPANIATQGQLLAVGLGKHVIDRSTASMEEHGGPIIYYLPVIIAAFIPWTVFLPLAARRLWRDGLGQPRLAALVWAWFVPTLVIFSLVATKLPHYILPVFPALAIAVAACLRPLDAGDRRWLVIGGWCVGGLLAVAGAVLIVVSPWPWFAWIPALHPMPALVGPGVALGVLLLSAVLLVRRDAGHPMRLVGAMALSVAAVLVLVAAYAGPAIESLKPARAIAERIRAVTPPSVPVFTMDEGGGFDEPSLYFYVDRFPVRKLRGDDQVVAWASQTGPAVLVIPRPLLAVAVARDPTRGPSLGCDVIGKDDIGGYNYSRGKWVDVVVLLRR